MNVGDIIHRLRKDRKMTLVELSQKSGVALATLSRIENGKMTGTLESHMNIAKALEITLPDFYKDLEAARRRVDVRTKKTRTDVFVHDKKATSEILASNILTKKMMPAMIRLDKNGATHKEQTKPGIEKFVYVLDGKVEANIGEERYILTKGSTLYFESSVPHHFRNVGQGESRLICVISPPAL